MAQQVISPNTGGTDFTIAAQSYKSNLNSIDILVDVPSLDATTFNDEPNEASEPGPTRAFFDIAGPLKQGSVSDGPLIPPPTNVAIQAAFGASNTISFTGDFTRARVARVAGGIGQLSATGRSRSAIVIAWKRT